MHAILAWTILSIGAVFVGLTLVIVGNKAWREVRQQRRRDRRAALEPAVLAYAHGSDVSIRAAVGMGSGRVERDVLEEVLLDLTQRVRGAELENLSRALDELGYVDHWIRGLSSRRWWRRAEAAEKLGISGCRRAIESLIPLMRDDVHEVRMRVAKALGILGGSSSVRELVQALNEPNRWSTIRIADILTGLGRRVVDELTASYETMNLPGRLAAVDILGRIRPLHSVPWLEARLEDPQRDVRARACHALGCIGDPGSTPALVRALGDEAWPVRAMAAKALGRVGQREGIEPLCGAMRDPEWWVRSNAARALRAMGTRGAAALETVLGSDDRFASDQAVLMLQEMGIVDLRARQLLSSDPAERTMAGEFLRRVIATGQVDRLRALAADPHEDRLGPALAPLLAAAAPWPHSSSAAEAVP